MLTSAFEHFKYIYHNYYNSLFGEFKVCINSELDLMMGFFCLSLIVYAFVFMQDNFC